MAATKLSDLAFVPETFQDYVHVDLMKRSAFFRSGAVVDSNIVFPQYGSTVTVPAWDGLDGDAEVESDGSEYNLEKIKSIAQVAPILQRGKRYGAHDLARTFTDSDPLGAFAAKVASFWARDCDKALVAAALGSAEGIENTYNGEIINTTSADIDVEALIDTRALFGEYQRDGLILVVNSDAYATLQKDDVVDAIPSETGLIYTVNEMQVIISDTITDDRALLVRPGAFLFSDGTDPELAVEYHRDAPASVSEYILRKRYTIAPVAAEWKGSPAGATATNTELDTAANWDLAGSDTLRYGVRVLDFLTDGGEPEPTTTP